MDHGTEGLAPRRELSEALKLLKSNRQAGWRAGEAHERRARLARAAEVIEADLKARGQLK